MSKFLVALLALVVLIAAIVVLAPQLIPARTYKARIEAAASEAIGRPVTIGDKISFRIIPTTAFSVNSLEVANAPGFDGPPLLSVARADLNVKLAPLVLKREVLVERFVLADPELNLEKRADGAVNWNLAARETAGDGSTEPAVRDLKLGDVRIDNGRISFSDQSSGQTYLVEALDARVRLNSLAEPLEIDGAMRFQGAASTVKLVLTTLADLSAARPANLKLDAKLGSSSIGADLALTSGDAVSYNGPIRFDAPDLPSFLKLFGIVLADSPGFERLNATGRATGDDGSLRLSGATIGFDAIDATGDVALDWRGKTPKASGALSIGTLDLRTYLPPPSTSTAGFPAWSTDTLDFTALRNVDADLDLTAEQLFMNGLRAGSSRVKLRILGGRMTADIPQIDLYGGGGAGRLIVDASGRAPAISGVFDFGSVQAQPLTRDAMKIDNLIGLGGLRLEFSASGASQAAIMSSLNGKGGFDLADGALKGINIAKLATAVVKLYEGGLTNPAAFEAAIAEARRSDEQTDFSKFLTEFQIVNGVANAPTITLDGPYLTMAGSGVLNLPNQALDIRLLPRASTSIDGASGRMVAIPVRVSGSFAKPVVAIDIEALLRGRAESILKDKLGSALGGRSETLDLSTPESAARSLIEGIVGGARERAQPAPDPSKEPPPAQSPQQRLDRGPASTVDTLANEALRGLFGKRPPANTPQASESEKDPDADVEN